MPECSECGEWVSEGYYRVFSDNDGILSACLECDKAGAHVL